MSSTMQTRSRKLRVEDPSGERKHIDLECSEEAANLGNVNLAAVKIPEILQNIFCYLNGEDLERCKVVNKRWNFVLGQIYPRKFVVVIKPACEYPSSGCEEKKTLENHVTIQKLYWSSQRSGEKEFNFPEAIALLLQESSKERKFCIDLRDEIPAYPTVDQALHDFLSKLGHLVLEFTLHSGNVYMDSLLHLSLHHYPNLHYLDLSHAIIRFFGGISWEHYYENLSNNKLCNLKRISFGQSLDLFEITDSFTKVEESRKVAELFIKIAPKLKEIHEFPVHLVDALHATGTTNLVKSISYPYNRLFGEHISEEGQAFYQEIIHCGGPLERALKRFADLEPKLTSFSFSLFHQLYIWERNDHPYPSNYFYLEYLKPTICRILRSSCETLETLILHPSGSFDFQDIPPLTSLKKIQIVYTDGLDHFELFPSSVNPDRIFPNVTVVEIEACFRITAEYFVIPSLLLPWRSNITELVLTQSCHLDTSTIQSLAESFPTVRWFKFLGYDGVSPSTFVWILPSIADSWPNMEFITIKMEDESTHGYTFDSIFTGIADKALTQLKTPGLRIKISREKLESFYANSTVRKMSNLKFLELDFQYWSSGARVKFLDKLYSITSLSKEFGFDYLPPTFKILIREKGSQYIFEDQRDLKRIQEDLASVVALEFETHMRTE